MIPCDAFDALLSLLLLAEALRSGDAVSVRSRVPRPCPGADVRAALPSPALLCVGIGLQMYEAIACALCAHVLWVRVMAIAMA